MPQLSIIMATCRPQWLANCLRQYQSQSLGGLTTQLIIVVEGEPKHFDPIISRYHAEVYYKSIQGSCGAFAKDVGLGKTKGDYVCFWDDDNIYYPHALTTLYATAKNFDIGIVKVNHMAADFNVIPTLEKVEFGDIDTMNFCVKRSLAIQARWSDHQEAGTDHAYLMKLLWLGAKTRYINVSIGEKLVGHC